VYPLTGYFKFIFEHKMKTYVKQSSFICVSSDTYFSFTKHHLGECQNVLLDLARHSPSNFGLSVAILMHMLRNIPHSPVAQTGYLRDALRHVHYDKVMDEFGTFFLHKLDLEKAVLIQIEEQDTDERALAMGWLKSVAKTKEKRAMEEAVMAIKEPTEQFPIGYAPTWEEVLSTMARNPTLLMSKWVCEERWDTRSTAGRLFLQFIIDYFLTLSTDILRNATLPIPKNLEEAMELWTLPSLMRPFKDVYVKPSGLVGNVPQRSPSFKDMVHLFFPDPELNIQECSVWHPFLIKGYIRELHETIYSMTEKDSASLLQNLGKIFGRVQCLPNAVACTTKACGGLCEQFEGGVWILTNPIFYKIERVGKAKRMNTARGKQVKASKAIIEAREQHRNIPFNEGRLKTRQVRKARKHEVKRTSGQKNNYRKPPVKRQKTPEPPPEESTSDEAHKSSDEDEDAPDVPSALALRKRGAFLLKEESEAPDEEDQMDEEDEEEEEEDQVDESEGDEDDSAMDVDLDF
jgi:hypothetical protein